MQFKIGDKVRKIGFDANSIHTISDISPHYVYLDGLKKASGKGVSFGTLMLVSREEPSNKFRVKIEEYNGYNWREFSNSHKEFETREDACKHIAENLQDDLESTNTHYRYILQEKGGWVDVPFEISVS